MVTKIEIYKSKNQFYWRMTRKGRIVADGSEGYERISKLKRALKGITTGGYQIVEPAA